MQNQSIAASVVFKTIDGFPGYRVGSDGTVWTCRKQTAKNYWAETPEWRELRQNINGMGYYVVGLSYLGNRKKFTVHTLVAVSFFGPRPDKMECRHLNGNPLDNRVENLQWGTSKENKADMFEHGTFSCGSKGYNAKLTDQDVQAIRSLKNTGVSQAEIGRQFGVGQDRISRIMNRKQWKHLTDSKGV